MDPLFEIDDLTVTYGSRTALAIREHVFQEGCSCGIIGSNGAGKTTLLEALAGLLPAARGRIRFRGTPLPQPPTAARALAGKVTLLLQTPFLFSGSVEANIACGPRFLGADARAAAGRAARALDRVGLDGFGPRAAAALSRGEAQRVALARALAVEAEALLLDEPLASVASEAMETVLKTIEDEKQRGCTLIIASHDIGPLMGLADTILHLDRGRLAGRRYANILSGTIGAEGDRRIFRTPAGLAFTVAEGKTGPARVALDPTDLLLSRSPFASSARNHLQGTVRRLEKAGNVLAVRVVVADTPLIALITPSAQRDLALQAGEAVFVTWKSTAAKMLSPEE